MKLFLVSLGAGLSSVMACSSSNGVEKSSQKPATPAVIGASLSSVRSASVLDTLRLLLKQRNPVIDEVALQDIRRIKYWRNYAAIGWGVRGDHNFQGSWEDELFVVMMLDSSLTRIVRVFDVLPSPRWLDFDLRIESTAGESLVVVGEGATYGDGPIRRTYSMSDSI